MDPKNSVTKGMNCIGINLTTDADEMLHFIDVFTVCQSTSLQV